MMNFFEPRGLLGLAVVLATCGIGFAQSVEPVAWHHPDLELRFEGTLPHRGNVELEFCLHLRAGVPRASVSVGYPRWRSGWRRWTDAVTVGIGHGRELRVHDSGPTCFGVFVPPGATELMLPIGEATLLLDTTGWTSQAKERRGEWRVDPRSAPGVPTRLAAELHWDGEKPFGDGALDAGEHGTLLVDVANLGGREAEGVLVVVDPPSVPGLSFPAEVEVPLLAPGVTRTVTIPFTAALDKADGVHTVTLRVREPYGHDAPPLQFELTARSAPLPNLVLTSDFAVEGAPLPVLRDQIVTVRLRVRNVGQGTAREATATIEPEPDVFRAHDSLDRFRLPDLAPGEVVELTYRCYANQRAERLGFYVDLASNSGQPLARSLVTLPLENSTTPAQIVRVSPDPRPQVSIAPPPPPLVSDIDHAAPMATLLRPTGLAVVLGVESYRAAPPASYAVEDARTAARYFERTLGIPSHRIELLLDEEVTLGQLHRLFGEDGWLARRAEPDSEVFVFFAGHGLAELEGFTPYVLPGDADPNYVRQTGFPIDRMVEMLAAHDVRRTSLFLDVCFSGLTRHGDAVIDRARPLVLQPVQPNLAGVSIYSAAAGSQLASALDEHGHGLFSYALFKGLGGAADLDVDRRVTAGELKEYLEETVPRLAEEIDREQSPTIALEDWDDILVQLP